MKIFYFLSLISLVVTQNILQSPCPGIFDFAEEDSQLFGVVTIRNSQYRTVTRINITLSYPIRLSNSYVGRIELYESSEITLSKIMRGESILYKVYFPVTNPLPNIVRIIYTDNIICSGPPAYGRYITTINLHHTFTTVFEQYQPVKIPTTSPRPIINNEIIGNNQYQPQPVYTYEPIQTTKNYYQTTPSTTRNYYQTTPSTTRNYYQPTPSTTRNYYQTTPSTTRNYYQPTPSTTRYTTTARTTPRPSFGYNYDICGEHRNTLSLINKGDKIDKGDYPWLVAMFTRKIISAGNLRTEFRCASSLISEKLIVSAAHCVVRSGNLLIESRDFLLKLGAYDLDDEFDENTINRGVSKIHVHTDYVQYNNLNDIAVLVMNRVVSFNEYIKPVCLWMDDNDPSYVFNTNGKVVGWGSDETGSKVTPEPREVTVPIVSTTTCRASHLYFFKYTSNTTLCGGNRDGAGPCRGDSGGGLYVKHKGKWTIRGIVSQSLKGESGCDLYQYVIYTDCAQFVDWILSIN